MAAAQELRAAALRTSDKEGEAKAWHAIATVHLMLEYEGPVADRSTPNDAADAADRAATIYRELGNRTGEGTALNTMAQARLRQNKLGQASKVAEQALGIFREKGETRSMVKALELIVEVHTLQSNPRQDCKQRIEKSP